mmetsp:Transcript_112376/g.239982  ORF Transcript_112376/g.239982 Transcript_112376/m.239982 type:complete len:307 (+) Transcript_112376:1513-2433(+)
MAATHCPALVVVAEEETNLLLILDHSCVMLVLNPLVLPPCQSQLPVGLFRPFLEGASLEHEVFLLVPHRVDRGGLVGRPEGLNVQIRRHLVDLPTTLTDARRKLIGLPHEGLVPHIDASVRVATMFPTNVGDSEALCLDNLQVQLSCVHCNLPLHALLQTDLHTRLFLGRWISRENPGGLHEEVASALSRVQIEPLREVLAPVRPRVALLLDRCVLNRQNESSWRRADRSQRRQPTLPKEIVPCELVLVPELDENALAHIHGIHEVLIGLLVSGVGDDDVKFDGEPCGHVFSAIVRRGQLSQGFAQ